MLISPTAQALVGEKSTTPPSRLVLSPLMPATGNAVHFVPSKWIVVWPTAQMSFVEEAETGEDALEAFARLAPEVRVDVDLGEINRIIAAAKFCFDQADALGIE